MGKIIKECNTNHLKPLTYDLSINRLHRTDASSSMTKVSILGMARQVFLPVGFPDSVSSDYFEYQLWDTMQAFASSVSGSLATAAVLGGLGVGDR